MRLRLLNRKWKWEDKIVKSICKGCWVARKVKKMLGLIHIKWKSQRCWVRFIESKIGKKKLLELICKGCCCWEVKVTKRLRKIHKKWKCCLESICNLQGVLSCEEAKTNPKKVKVKKRLRKISRKWKCCLESICKGCWVARRPRLIHWSLILTLPLHVFSSTVDTCRHTFTSTFFQVAATS